MNRGHLQLPQFLIQTTPPPAADPQYIVHLIGQVISVSLETVKIVAGLPELGIGEEEGEEA